jgi:hypothetical protein
MNLSELQASSPPFLAYRRRFSSMPQALAPFLGCPQGYGLGDFEKFGSGKSMSLFSNAQISIQSLL